MPNRGSRPQTPRRSGPKTVQLFWTETVLQLRIRSMHMKYVPKPIFKKQTKEKQSQIFIFKKKNVFLPCCMAVTFEYSAI